LKNNRININDLMKTVVQKDHKYQRKKLLLLKKKKKKKKKFFLLSKIKIRQS